MKKKLNLNYVFAALAIAVIVLSVFTVIRFESLPY